MTEAEWDERFECEEMLSSLALPIEVGDIFKVHDLYRANTAKKGVDRYYVLLAQECDLSVRGNGKRSNDLTRVVLTQLSPIDVNREDGRVLSRKIRRSLECCTRRLLILGWWSSPNRLLFLRLHWTPA